MYEPMQKYHVCNTKSLSQKFLEELNTEYIFLKKNMSYLLLAYIKEMKSPP